MTTTKLPLYKEVTAQLIANLVTGKWRPGEMMPSEAKLAEMHGVGISTVRQALRDLEADHLLVRRQGKGTFVALHSSPRHQDRFHSLVGGDGSKEIPHRTLISSRRVKPPQKVAQRLGLRAAPSRPNAHYFRFVSSVGSTPIMVTEITLPIAVFPDLTRKDLPNGTVLLYGIFQTTFHVNVIRMEEELTAVLSDPETSKLLNVPRGAPILKIERVAYTFHNVAVEFRESWVNTQYIRYYRDQGTAY